MSLDVRLCAAGVLTAVAVMLALPAAAQDLRSTSLTVGSESPSRSELPDYLTASLATGEGSPLSDQTINFYVRAEILGERFALVGDGVTDTSGLAKAPFTPRRATYTVRAIFTGTDQYGPARMDAEVRFPAERVVSALPEPHVHALLAPVRTVMPIVISGLVGLVWVLLIGLATWTVSQIRAGGRSVRGADGHGVGGRERRVRSEIGR